MDADLDSAVPVPMDEVDTSPITIVRHILVVDDTPANLIAAEAALAPLRRPVITASSGTDALARLLEHEFAVVLLDVFMPDMDGFETARWIRSRERTQHLPIIFMTAHDHDQTSVLRAYALGAVDFLFKPVLPEVLRAKASVFVSLQERTEQLAAERMEHAFDNRRLDYETTALRRERDREIATSKELARLNKALAEADRRKDGFIAILAHELRNPLAPVRTALDLVKQEPDKPLTPKMIDILDRQTAMLSRLVDDLLDLSRIKADKIELRPELIDLAEVLDGAVAMCRPAIDKRKHTLLVDVPGAPVRVVVDSIRMAQVLCNILNNAARYTPAGGRIEVSCCIDGDQRMRPDHGHRHRDPRGAAELDLPDVRAGARALRRHRRPRPRARARAPADRDASRDDPRRERRAREGQHVRDHGPARRHRAGARAEEAHA